MRVNRSVPWHEVVYWALDFETGGLDPARNPVLSVGMVPVRGGIVKVGESFYSLIRAGGNVARDGLVVHHILPSEVAGAPSRKAIIEEIDGRLRGAVLLVHSAPMDVPFLRRFYKQCGRRPPRPRVVDTAALASRALGEWSEMPSDLGGIRERLGLPRYREHHALSDALATAELFLVLRHHIGARTLRDLT